MILSLYLLIPQVHKYLMAIFHLLTDKHMSRVFSDVTPTTRSPKLRSPTIGRRRGGPPIVPGFSQRVRRERVTYNL